MDTITFSKYSARAEVVKAMAHPTRLFIIDELLKNECSVLDLTRMIEADVSTVSKHLALLRSAGIVKIEKRGTQVFYSLKVPCLKNFIPCIEAVLENSAIEKRNCL
ncbi:MAG: winged helix-turn-helix transcriptional regulator [Candidatus Riflebacteria bacterium]|nr:winged helix-turn-helix transcriptional regulator [Candidatus Riflebacteria bacterium]